MAPIPSGVVCLECPDVVAWVVNAELLRGHGASSGFGFARSILMTDDVNTFDETTADDEVPVHGRVLQFER